MKILFVCHRIPFPPNRGGKIRPFHMIEHLGRKHSVVVASLAHSKRELDEAQGLANHCQQILADVVPSPVRWMQASRSVLSRTPSSVAYFWSRRLAGMVRKAAEGNAFDVVFVHCAFAAQYVLDISCPLRVLDFGDVDSAKWFAYARSRAFPLRMGYRLEAEKLRRYERHLASEFDICTATTEGELEELKKLGVPVPSTVIPNGVDLEYFHPRPENPRDSAVIVFLGRMDYFPNIDGTVFFANEIFPLIRKTAPRAQFRIIGSNPTRAVRDLARTPGISVTGHVPDVRPYLVDAAVAVAPLRIARGTQNKILQFLAMGVPVVTTTDAAKGVGATPGRHFLAADGPEEFAAAVLRLLQDAELREALSVAGREPLKTAHSWPSSMEVLDQLLEKKFAATEHLR
jgi:sugar transferase (PEP-CTERM/EpsH1 system associated)